VGYLAAVLFVFTLPGAAYGQVTLENSRPSFTVGNAPARSLQNVEGPRGFHGFMHDIWGDYKNFVSFENAEWAAVGGTAALVVHSADEMLRTATQAPTPFALQPGSTYGNLSFQFPLAFTWWIAGHATNSARAADAGRDLVRAQISALSWTYALKYAVDRTRPNGDPRSFPSGHASATFATAMVLQRHYGWKVGVPMFVASTYTAAERITENKHWASDVTFGAVVGILAGRTVTLHVGQQHIHIEPQAVAGGGGVRIRVLP
jgi:membrane-associated phospholipid phosphatase